MKNLLAILLLALVITSCNKEEEVITTLNTITLNKDSADVEIFNNLDIEWTTYTMYPTVESLPNSTSTGFLYIYDTTYVLKIKFKGVAELWITSELPLQPQEGDITSKQGALSLDSVSMIAHLNIIRDLDAMTGSNSYHSKVVSGAEQDIVINTDLSIDSEGNHTITRADLSFKGSEVENDWTIPTTKTIDIHIER
tara:strand:+ start:95 stop:682 length:588 start_codon:yes stop_codon:yes gene_type:complete